MSENVTRAESPPPVDRLSALWQRVNRHKIVQWSVAYVALAYGIQHAIILTGESFEWPNAVPRTSMLLFALGLPLVITFAWYHGERASRRFSTGECTIISLLLLCASLLFYSFVRPEAAAVPSRAAQQASVTAARAAAASPKGSISVAVLPFLNLSSDKDQEFFSDGMTEEITTALAKVPDLRVVGRTSAFQFKGANKDLRSIGQALSATHLLEGSVRKAGNRVRITAQLIKSDDGTHLWAEDYDRDLTDVFAIQEDIARAITSSLHMTLGLKPGENLVNNRQIDPQTYTDYLRIRATVNAIANTSARTQAVAELEKIVVRHPDFAPAWAYLARVHSRGIGTTWWGMWLRPVEETRRLQDEELRQTEHEAREAMRLDPGQADAYAGLGQVEISRGHWATAADLMRKALTLDADNPGILDDNARFEIQTGHVQHAVDLAQKAYSLDPLSPIYSSEMGLALLAQNRPNEAIAFMEAHPDRRVTGLSTLAEAYAATGQFGKAAEQIAGAKIGGFYKFDPKSMDAAEALMRALAAKKPPTEVLHNIFLNWIFAYSRDPDLLMEAPERASKTNLLEHEFIFAHNTAAVRKTERFRKFLRDVGLVEYWRTSGWPDFCHPTTGDDFECS